MISAGKQRVLHTVRGGSSLRDRRKYAMFMNLCVGQPRVE